MHALSNTKSKLWIVVDSEIEKESSHPRNVTVYFFHPEIFYQVVLI